MLYLCDLFLILIFIFIMISWIKALLLFSAYFLEYVLLFLDENVDEECE